MSASIEPRLGRHVARTATIIVTAASHTAIGALALVGAWVPHSVAATSIGARAAIARISAASPSATSDEILAIVTDFCRRWR
ncbi:MAG: hypothetical protein SFX73_34245 [Kofleriaceae bacterium]|nr:hypothetical protein [Kofleriaceae bacterium]